MPTDSEIKANDAAQTKADAAQTKIEAKGTDLIQARADDLAKALADHPDQALALPDIHFLQAQRQAIQMNRDELDPPANRAKDAQIALFDAQLAYIDQILAANTNLTNPPANKVAKDT